ncbi:tRNA (adenosine(37)-N6)-dimethylallyltransferase MiaA [Pedobacter sp. HMF7647]|uniref:tRNA dimethylallyltransferase n=1 Tax=Hufsiella arboris TaxID=2695275 RepID=A0A7K1YG26_9SPHI|nr:tRNA (adenosine(37)-N6)-dimethylallyltransferase MiaA [Hufsiella arboris]MXV53108.1 tRNA (adenosine(37)-N6)-dimethylallyltransferase MiaA [Hufsiella arboris]
MQPEQHTLITVVGPTAVGKTELAIRLAGHFNTEIVSADSRQFYREMEIGTAKPNDTELSQARHHFINSHSIEETVTAGDYETQALSVIDKIFHQNPLAILAGGSGLFINALLNGIDDLPKVPEDIRQQLNSLHLTEGIEPLQEELRTKDPDYYRQVDLQNPQRIIRALEVIRATNKPFSSFQSGEKKQRNFITIKVGLNMPREILYDRINKRVDLMVQNGLVEEARTLLPYKNHYALQTVGYSELFDYFDDKITLDKAIDQIKQNTRRYAKRQITWFRRDTEIAWFEPGDFEKIISYISGRLS